MGQNHSAYGPSRSVPTTPRQEERGRSRSKSPPPPEEPSPPPIPKVLSYAVPENRVLPYDAGGDLPSQRHFLRPVSQELARFHPDFVDIFKYPAGDGDGPASAPPGGLAVRPGGKENVHSAASASASSLVRQGSTKGAGRSSHAAANGDAGHGPRGLDFSARSQSLREIRANGFAATSGDPAVSVHPSGSDVTERERGRSVQRSNSLDRTTAAVNGNPPKVRVHKRFPSVSTPRLAGTDVIPEDPREHLYTHWRQDPYSHQPPAGVTSLPLKSTFDLDYKMNLTYAQLGEHRRQQRLTELEDKTGKKLAELTADLQDQSSLPVSPFDRYHYTPSKTSAGSTSSDTGVSKSKKRRAPPPPAVRDDSPGRLSLDSEPPIDYDLEDPSPSSLEASTSSWKLPVNLSRKSSTASAISMASRASKGPAPPPPPTPQAPPAPSLSPSASSPRLPLITSNPGVNPGVPAAPAGAVSSAATTTKPKAPESGRFPLKTASAVSADTARLIAQAKAELEALKKLDMILKEKDKHKAGREGEASQGNGGGTREQDSEQIAVTGAGRDGPTKDVEECTVRPCASEEASRGVGRDGPTEEAEVGTVRPCASGGAAGHEDGGLAAEDEAGNPSPMSASFASIGEGQPHAATIPATHDAPSPKATAVDEEDPTDNKPNAARRLSSLLQHDIVLAAQARVAKGQMKTKTPVQLERPKDAAQMFREELAKAAHAREERVKSSVDTAVGPTGNVLTSDKDVKDDGSCIVFKSDLVKVKRKPFVNETTLLAVTDSTRPLSDTSSTVINVASPERKLAPPVLPKPTDPANSKSEPDLVSSVRREVARGTSHTEGTPPRQRPPQGFDDAGAPLLRKAVSHNGILNLSDEDDVAEPKPPVTPSSFSSAQMSRDFGEDWKPEDDLDSDDDMHDEFGTFSRNAAAMESSGGFKSSIIPGQVKDLKAASTKASSKSSSSGSRRESGSSTDEKHKFGSLRKFQKSVHQSVRNAFGSISKASGKILSRRHKSHDFAAEKEQEEEEEEEAKADPRKFNGKANDHATDALSRRLKPTPARVNEVTDGSHLPNANLSDHDTDSPSENAEARFDEKEEEDMEDGALPDDARTRSRPTMSDNHQAELQRKQQPRKMKRAGVAYVSQKGQIIVLPEFETVEVDEDGRVLQEKPRRGRLGGDDDGDDDDDQGRAPRIFRKKKKKFTYESTVRQVEKGRAAEQMAEEIRNKERDMAYERQTQLEMDRQFQRLRDMETQERMARLQTAQLQQQMSLLQQQQQQLQFLQSPGASSLTTAPHPHHQRYSVPEFGGPYTPVTPGTAGVGPQPHPHRPPVSLSTAYSLQPPGPGDACYPPTSAPASAGGVGPAASLGGVYGDIHYLNNYIRVMGTQPPTTQQQWAYLLASLAGGGGVAAAAGPDSSIPVTSPEGQGLLAGPDLSHLFASNGASAVSPYRDPSALMASAPSGWAVPQTVFAGFSRGAEASLPNHAGFGGSALTEGSASSEGRAGGPVPDKSRKTTVVHNGDVLRERNNPMYCSSDEDDDDSDDDDDYDDDDDDDPEAEGAPVTKSTTPPRTRGSETKTSRRRVAPPAGSTQRHSSMHRDGTPRRDEARVTRVHVPDYRVSQFSVALEDGRNGEARDGVDLGGGTSRAHAHPSTSAVPYRLTNGAEAGPVDATDRAAAAEGASDNGREGFRAVAVHSSSSTPSRAGATGSHPLSARVYGPLGYRPVAFSQPTSPRSKLQAEGSLDR